MVALDGVDADLPQGSFTAVVGASGSGKSTLLHTMAGLDEPTGGQVSLLGTVITSMTPAKRAAFRSRNVGFVFQDYNLIASLTAAENVSMPSRLAGHPLERGRSWPRWKPSDWPTAPGSNPTSSPAVSVSGSPSPG